MLLKDFDSFYEYMEHRIDRRVHTIKKRAARALRKYKKVLSVQNSPDQEDRVWLDSFVKGEGVDICCGDFLVDGAIGVDGAVSYIGESAAHVLGADYRCDGDELSFAGHAALDFVVTNYFEALPHTLNALNEWWRVLKPGGVLAIVCMDAEAYPSKYPMGPLKNRQKNHTYTAVTITQYLYRAEFSDVKVEKTEHGTLRVSAIKKRETL